MSEPPESTTSDDELEDGVVVEERLTATSGD